MKYTPFEENQSDKKKTTATHYSELMLLTWSPFLMLTFRTDQAEQNCHLQTVIAPRRTHLRYTRECAIKLVELPLLYKHARSLQWLKRRARSLLFWSLSTCRALIVPPCLPHGPAEVEPRPYCWSWLQSSHCPRPFIASRGGALPILLVLVDCPLAELSLSPPIHS